MSFIEEFSESNTPGLPVFLLTSSEDDYLVEVCPLGNQIFFKKLLDSSESFCQVAEHNGETWETSYYYCEWSSPLSKTLKRVKGTQLYHIIKDATKNTESPNKVKGVSQLDPSDEKWSKFILDKISG